MKLYFPRRDTAAHRFVAVFASALMLAFLAFAGCKKASPTSAAPPAAGPIEVGIVTIVPEAITLTQELPGRTTPYLVAEVRPQVTGIVQKRLFTEGGLVKAGDPLYQLDDATYRAELNSAKAALERAQAALELARLNATRSASLAEAAAVSRQENENAIAGLRQEKKKKAVAEAAVTGAEVVLSYSRITSPISGRIGISTVTQGALVTANQATPLVTVQQLDPMYVDLTQSSREWLQLRRDLATGTLQRTGEMPAAIFLEDGTRYPQPGKLAFTEVTVEPTTGSFALRIVVPNPDEILLPGMYVRAALNLGVRERALLVPQRGIARDAKGNSTAMVVDAENKVQLRPVRVSRTIGDRWLVEAGLVAGDKVVVEGLQKIRPGAEVKTMEFTPTPVGTAPANPNRAKE